MNQVVSRYVTLILLLGTFGWLVHDFGWEPFLAFIVALVAEIGLTIYDFRTRAHREEFDAADRRLFQDFLELMPSSSGTVNLLRECQFNAFRLRELEELDRFVEGWGDAGHEFHNQNVEKRRQYFFECSAKLRHYINLNTFTLDNGLQGLPKEWESTQPGRREETYEELCRLAKNALHDYEELVRTGRRELRV